MPVMSDQDRYGVNVKGFISGNGLGFAKAGNFFVAKGDDLSKLFWQTFNPALMSH